jgi:hypothetical protein
MKRDGVTPPVVEEASVLVVFALRPTVEGPAACNLPPTGPDGTRLILLGKADAVVSIAVGTPLDNGDVVESISPASIGLRYGTSETRATLPIPGADDAAQP